MQHSRPKSQWEMGMTTSERMATVGIDRQWVKDTTTGQMYMFDGVTPGGVAMGGGTQGPPGPPGPEGPPGDDGAQGPAGPAGTGFVPSGFVWQDGKLYWGGGAVPPTVFIPAGMALYVDNVTGEMKVM